MSWDVVILKMFGHLGELTLPSEGEDWTGIVDVDHSLPTDAEGGAAFLFHHSCTGHCGLRKTGGACIVHTFLNEPLINQQR